MNVKLSDIVSSTGALQKLMLSGGLTAKVKYQLSRIFEVAAKEAQRYEEQRQELVRRLGTQVSKENEPEMWSVKPENVEQFNNEIVGLMDIEIALYGQPIPVETILEGVTNDVTGGDLFMLRWLIRDEIEESAKPPADAEAAQTAVN